MREQRIVPAASGIGFRLQRGERLRVVDANGGQTGDLVAFSADGRERLSNGRTFDYGGKVHLSTGDVLWSDASRPMLTIVADDAGRHDFLHGACSSEMYRIHYGLTAPHANCTDNLSAALTELGVAPHPLPTPLNLFMRADVAPDGRLTVSPAGTRAGSAIVLRAEMDLVVAVSSCPASICNGGAAPRPLAVEVFGADADAG